LAIQPVIGRMMALATRYEVSAHAASSVLTERLPAMCGSETLTTVVSSTSMKVANITATATIHGLTWGCGIAVDGIRSLVSMMPQTRHQGKRAMPEEWLQQEAGEPLGGILCTLRI
jgi:hypothetical protein